MWRRSGLNTRELLPFIAHDPDREPDGPQGVFAAAYDILHRDASPTYLQNEIRGLPSDAIETTADTGGPGDPVKRITLNMDYEFEIVLKLVGSKATDGRLNSESEVN